MLAYYFNLALRSFKRNKVLTALMVLAIALGIGACMTTLTVFAVLSGNPLPGKSDRLFYVQVDPRPAAGYVSGEEPERELSRLDAEALLREGRAPRQVMMSGGNVIVDPGTQGSTPYFTDARYTSADFFAMFDAPLLYGRGWTKEDDEARARVVVISRETNDRVFGGEDSVGRTLRLVTSEFQVVGVLDDWRPVPKFYDLTTGRFGATEDVFLPFSTSRDLDFGTQGSTNCWASHSEDSYALNAPCAWIQYWVELDEAAQAGGFKAYLENYSAQQNAAGRFERDPNVRLRNVMEWLEFNRVVPADVRLQVWLAFGFLLVCLINTVGLLLAKFLRRSGEIGVRRALGAPRTEIFRQCLVEAGTIGLAGGGLGLGVALLGLWAVRQQPASYAKLAQMDLPMLGLTFALAVLASLLAGLLPAWRATQITPAIQLKSQ